MSTTPFGSFAERSQQVVGEPKKGRLPGPVFKGVEQRPYVPMSDLQIMLDQEKKQHQEAYGYQHGMEPLA